MKRQQKVLVDEIAAFMNDGWPGEEWYLDAKHDFLWETTFTTGENGVLYQARRPGTVVDLVEYEGCVRWQGSGPDPTDRRGHKLTELFQTWQRKRRDAVVMAYVPRHKLAAITESLKTAGCLVVNGDAPTTIPSQNGRRPPDLIRANRTLLPHLTAFPVSVPQSNIDVSA